jgi:hypothetical protein
MVKKHRAHVQRRCRRTVHRRGKGFLRNVFKKGFHVINEIGKPFRDVAGSVFDTIVPGSGQFVGVGSDMFDKLIGNGVRRQRRRVIRRRRLH